MRESCHHHYPSLSTTSSLHSLSLCSAKWIWLNSEEYLQTLCSSNDGGNNNGYMAIRIKSIENPYTQYVPSHPHNLEQTPSHWKPHFLSTSTMQQQQSIKWTNPILPTKDIAFHFLQSQFSRCILLSQHGNQAKSFPLNSTSLFMRQELRAAETMAASGYYRAQKGFLFVMVIANSVRYYSFYGLDAKVKSTAVAAAAQQTST